LIGVGGAGPGASLDEQSMQDALAKGLAKKLPKRVRAIVLEPKFIDLDEPAPVLVMPAKGTNIPSGTNRDISIWPGQHEEKGLPSQICGSSTSNSS
jgi:hypothetical protein